MIRKKSDDTCVNPKIKHRIHEGMCQVFNLNLEAFNFRYNISFIDPPLGGFGEILPSVMIFPSGQSPSGNIITSCNISPNPPRSRSINDKYYIILYYIILYYIILYYIILYYIILYYIILYYIILYYIIFNNYSPKAK